jgi:hypothetical protein
MILAYKEWLLAIEIRQELPRTVSSCCFIAEKEGWLLEPY